MIITNQLSLTVISCLTVNVFFFSHWQVIIYFKIFLSLRLNENNIEIKRPDPDVIRLLMYVAIYY